MKFSQEYSYARGKLIKSGIDFKRITKENIMVTCKEYDGIISERNYSAILTAINDMYEGENLLEAMGI
jgi:hypothetical protein